MFGRDSQFTLAEVFVLGPMGQPTPSPPDAQKRSTPRASSRKVKWTPEEDRILTESIEQHGTSNWSLIANALPGRSGKQCRERWTNQLDPQLNRENWTPQEDALLLLNQQRFGNAWSKIMHFLPRRSCNSVKNRWCWLTRHRTHPPRVSQLLPYLQLSQGQPRREVKPLPEVKIGEKCWELPLPITGETPGTSIDFTDIEFSPSLVIDGGDIRGMNDPLDSYVMPAFDTIDSSDLILKSKWL